MRGLVVNYYSMFFKYFFLLSCLLYYLFSFLYGSVLEFGIGGGVGGQEQFITIMTCEPGRMSTYTRDISIIATSIFRSARTS